MLITYMCVCSETEMDAETLEAIRLSLMEDDSTSNNNNQGTDNNNNNNNGGSTQ